MKTWEEMKDFSYVNIKLTKAHSITEGLKRCQVQKLTRNNPIYQHLRLHQKYKKMRNCVTCLRSNSTKMHKKLNSYSLTEPFIKTYTSENKFNFKRKQSQFFSQITCEKQQFRQVLSNKNFSERQIKKFTNKIQEMTNDLRKTKSSYFKYDSDRVGLQRKFLRDIKALEVGVNEDQGINLEQLSKNRSIFRSSLERKNLKMKKDNQKVKQMNKQVFFPFSHRQMEIIVVEDKKIKQNIQVKSNKMIRSIYDYKSSANFSNRMKTIKKNIQK